MAESTTFQIAYDGPALQAGRMDVRDLAPALLAVGELCQAANRLLDKQGGRVAVNVTADFKRGSFQVDLEFIQTLAQQAQSLLFSREVGTGVALAAILGLAKGAKVSLLALFKWLKGQRPQDVTTLSNGNVRITLQVNNQIEVRPEVIALYNDPEVRRYVREVLKPLEQPGIEVFETRQHGEVIERVHESELPAFDLAEASREVDAAEHEMVVQVVKPSFTNELKWTLSTGAGNFYADMVDRDFYERVQRRDVTFGNGDLLRVRMFVQTYVTERGNITSLYTIREVLAVIQPPRQIPFGSSDF